MARRTHSTPVPGSSPLVHVLLGAHVAMVVIASSRLSTLRLGWIPWLDAGIGLALAGGFLWGLKPVWDGRTAEIPKLLPAGIAAYYAALVTSLSLDSALAGWGFAVISITLAGVLVAQSFNDLGAAVGEVAPLALQYVAGATLGAFTLAIALSLHGHLVSFGFPVLTILLMRLVRESEATP